MEHLLREIILDLLILQKNGRVKKMVSKIDTHKNFPLSFQYLNAFIQIPLLITLDWIFAAESLLQARPLNGPLTTEKNP